VLNLTDRDRAMANGDAGPAPALAMSILVRMADVYGATALMDISQAHIDSTIYLGDATLEFAERLASLGARVAVPTSLNVSGATTLTTLTVTGNATVQGNLTVTGTANFQNIVINGHIKTGGTTPLITAGAATGTGASVSIEGNDTAGTITITTGVSGLSADTLAKLVFNKTYGSTPRVIISPTNAAAATFSTYLNSDNTSFLIKATQAPGASTTYTYNYYVVE